MKEKHWNRNERKKDGRKINRKKEEKWEKNKHSVEKNIEDLINKTRKFE